MLALSLSLLTAACGGSHKHAESPDPTEKGWSGASSDAPQPNAGPSIQPATPKNAPSPEASAKPEALSQAEADVMAGKALPPSPHASDKAETPAKPAKKKPGTKSRKKRAKPT